MPPAKITNVPRSNWVFETVYLWEQQSFQSILISQSEMKGFILLAVICPLSIVAEIRVLQEEAETDTSFEVDQADRSGKCNK